MRHSVQQTLVTGQGAEIGARAKLKFDAMIVATARAHEAEVIYSDDTGIKQLGKALELRVVGISQLQPPVPTLFDK